MTTSRTVSLLTILLAAFLCLLTPMAGAELIATEDTLPENRSQTDRDKVQSFLDRATVAERLKALGVEDGFIKPRVDSLTDAEARVLAARIDALPTGGAMSDYQLLIVILLIAILVAIVV
jgi:hypothetical protein